MPINLEDAMKVLMPLVAGGVSAYSRPAARAIQGASGAYMAMDEDKRREAAQAQELALRNKEADLRGQEIAASTDRSKHAMTREDQTYANQQGGIKLLGATLGNLINTYGGPATAPLQGTSADPGVVVSGGEGISEDQAAQNANIANAARVAQGAVNIPSVAGPTISRLLAIPEVQATMAQSIGQFNQTLAQRKAEAAAAQQDRAANRGLQERNLASEDAYRKGIVGVRNQEADTHAAAKAAPAKNIDPEKLATAIDKANADLEAAQSKLQVAQASNDPSVIHDASEQATLRALALQRLKGQRSAVTGTSTGAGYLAKLGIGAGQ